MCSRGKSVGTWSACVWGRMRITESDRPEFVRSLSFIHQTFPEPYSVPIPVPGTGDTARHRQSPHHPRGSILRPQCTKLIRQMVACAVKGKGQRERWRAMSGVRARSGEVLTGGHLHLREGREGPCLHSRQRREQSRLAQRRRTVEARTATRRELRSPGESWMEREGEPDWAVLGSERW